MHDDRQDSFDEEPQSKVETERSRTKQRSLGFFRRAIPSMSISLAVLSCLLNIFIPGLGTLISSFSLISCDEGALSLVLTNLLAAFLQLITSPILIGIIWSWQWGFLFIVLSRQWYRPLSLRTSSLDCIPCSYC